MMCEYQNINCPKRKRLYAGTLAVNKIEFAGTVPANKNEFVATIPGVPVPLLSK